MKYYYDFHIHSALSPCAEDEMTPNNIVNLARINGLDMIALTDHNSTHNLRPLEHCAKAADLIFLPGIEVESAEEVHIVCLFADVDAAEEMGRLIKEHLPPMENKEEIFGPEYIFDSEDNIIGKERQLLLFSTDLTVEEIFAAAERIGGCAYFAHIDRDSYSVLAVLGAIPPAVGSSIAEVTDTEEGRAFVAGRKDLAGMRFLFSSDCHRLADMSRKRNYLDLPVPRSRLTARDVINWIKDMR